MITTRTAAVPLDDHVVTWTGSARSRNGRQRRHREAGKGHARARQANVDLHSLRRRFITKARDVLSQSAQGFTMYTVADVVGHQKGELGLSMTSRYAGRETMAAKAACGGRSGFPA